MSGTGPVGTFIGRLLLLACDAGVDVERLVAEVTDHLAEAAARHRLAGLEPAEAERRAIEEFGAAETLVSAVAAQEKGTVMNPATRVMGIIAMLAATATLAIAHIVSSDSAPGTVRIWIAGGAVVVMGFGLAVLASASRRHLRVTAPAWWMVTVGSTAALGALAAWEGGRIDVGSIHMRGGDRAYLAAIAALAVLIVLATRALGRRGTAGFALVLAGGTSLLFDGIWSPAWQPLGSIGEGRANMGIELILVGWVLLTMSWLTSTGAAGARALVGRWLVSLGRRLSAAAAPPTEAEPQANP
ncbi:MAG: permease prefix domain 1-containing protein [Actinomycetota bacterium]